MSTYLEGRAATYEQFSPKPSPQLINFLITKLKLNQDEKLNNYIDIGCGTGQLTIPLSRYFNKTIGIDFTPDMISEAKKSIAKCNCGDIELIQESAENLNAYNNWEAFDLITFGNSFHRVDHSRVVPWILKALKSEGHLVLIRTHGTLLLPDSEWQRAFSSVTEKWFNVEEKTVSGDTYFGYWDNVLKKYPFSSIDCYYIPEEIVWTIENLLGYCYMLSFCPIRRDSSNRAAFEQDVRDVMLKICPDNKFVQRYKSSLIIASI